ncbi:MAG TPA: hypothetical protein VEK15_27285 [Vicinamibacteria bacterium]|nr:hypothetical protein [Vicinamibacteria bacterium]
MIVLVIETPRFANLCLAAALSLLSLPSLAADSHYLFVWAADADSQHSDFLAVLDADPESPAYGDVLRTVEVGMPSGAHHSEHRMPADGRLFVNGFSSGHSFVIDLHDPLAPSVAARFESMGEFSYPHSFERLSNGNLLATFQNGQGTREATGGIAELTPSGNLVRAASAADADFPEVRPYSLLPLPEVDLVVSTTTDMMAKLVADSIQFWRLSDLTLLQTMRLPKGPRGFEHQLPAEPRIMADKKTLLVNTFLCGLYQVHDYAASLPSIRHIHTFEISNTSTGDDNDELCALPVTVGPYWVQTVPSRNGLVTLDLGDPSSPKEVSYLSLGEGRLPHWIALEPGSRRIVATGYGGMLHSVMMVIIDPATGALAIDRSFGEDGVADFGRTEWPHGSTGAAVPHGSVFAIP